MEEKTIREHMNDLKKYFLWMFLPAVVIFVILFLLSPYMIEWLINYFGISMQNVVSLTPFDGIQARLTISGQLTLLLMIPILLFGLYKFSEVSLSKRVKKRVKYYFLGSLIVAVVGMFFGIFIFSKLVLGNLINNYQIVNPMWGIRNLMSFVFVSGVSLALMMQTIILIPVLNDMGLLDVEKMKKCRLFVLLGVFIVAAFITPPDVVSQFLMVIPFYGSFELGMLLTKIKFKEVKK